MVDVTPSRDWDYRIVIEVEKDIHNSSAALNGRLEPVALGRMALIEGEYKRVGPESCRKLSILLDAKLVARGEESEAILQASGRLCHDLFVANALSDAEWMKETHNDHA